MFIRSRLPLIVCILIAGAVSCPAKLGDKIEACASGYGQQISRIDRSYPDGSYFFKKGDYTISLLVYHGVVVSELIQKSGGFALTETEREKFLQNESGAWTKNPAQSDKTVEYWQRADGSFAVYNAEYAGLWLGVGSTKWPLNQADKLQVLALLRMAGIK